MAINYFGLVAVHGAVVLPDGGDPVAAVFTQEGVVVKEGDNHGIRRSVRSCPRLARGDTWPPKFYI